MRSIFAATLTALLLACTGSWAQVADDHRAEQSRRVTNLLYTRFDNSSADEPKRTMPHREKCAVPLPTDFWNDSAAEPFRRAEEWAWNERICFGHRADMRNAPREDGTRGDGDREVCEPAKLEDMGESVPAYRELRPEFLELILSHEPWASAQRHPEVRIQCALVRGDVSLSHHEIVPNFWFQQSKICGGVRLVGTKFKRSLILERSMVTGKLRGEGLEVGGSLVLGGGGTFADVGLVGAKVAGSASFRGSTVTGKLNADRLEVGWSLFLGGGGTFADVDLLGAKVAGSASFRGSAVTGKLNADRLEVGGDLSLGEGGSFADVDLLGAKIAGNADLIGSTVTGKLSADGLEVGGDLFLRDGSTFSDIHLPGARIGGDVQLAGSKFRGEFNLTGAAIGGELHLSSQRRGPAPTWQHSASLILRNAKADVLQARQDSWNISGKAEILPTDLTGFLYNHLGGLEASGGTNMGDESVDWLIGWVEAQRDHGKHYDPQPYTQLAQVLDAAGATEKAKSIRYAKFEHKLEDDKSMGTFHSAVLTLERYLVGYGVYPFRALYWFFGLVLVGGLLAQCSKDASVRRWAGLWYSLENSLPLIDTSEHFRNVVHDHPSLVHFFHLQKVFGFVLATILVGALTLLDG